MRVVVAGSSGLIGTALVAGLRESGHEVLRLVRRTPSAPDERGWDPPSGRIDDGALDGADVAVNLGGVGIADRPWSGARRQAIRDSRIVPTEVLAQGVAQAGVPALVSASAVGFYGDTGPQEVEEGAPSGEGFLAGVCRDWEAATAPAAEAGARVVTIRTGLVLSPSGGLLALMRPVWKSFLGARIGSGEQYMPWVSLDDEVAGLRFAVETPALSGPVNMTGPTPVTNAAFTQTLAQAVGRPAPMVIPGVVVSTLLGDMGRELLLFSQRAVPRALLDAGFTFRHPTLADALSAAVH
ncbi:TIGR01777 family oxidoreductase [Pseudonocardia sp. WMMC193]|uniref:TIGR01777 family oxidoreductase n=1 Tax=Pseudonocardia sp. WMMC193 TaxID=2911965 RepID=UPI001F02A409|nr:TIGR01777 family oxidoreductase [Pseudonocardia sp. WMMC193]MCF7548126.1 TIGR01777 family oxidoreductase [Pseudonocardia sp. WMMC193]